MDAVDRHAKYVAYEMEFFFDVYFYMIVLYNIISILR